MTAQTFRYRLEVQPPALRFSQALVKRDYAASIRLENRGSTDVEILSIESDVPWINVVARAARFTLLCPESAVPKTVSPTMFSRGFDFRVICSPRELAAGKHRGSVTIRPQGQEPLVLPVELTVVKPKEYGDYIASTSAPRTPSWRCSVPARRADWRWFATSPRGRS